MEFFNWIKELGKKKCDLCKRSVKRKELMGAHYYEGKNYSTFTACTNKSLSLILSSKSAKQANQIVNKIFKKMSS